MTRSRNYLFNVLSFSEKAQEFAKLFNHEDLRTIVADLTDSKHVTKSFSGMCMLMLPYLSMTSEVY